MVQEAVAALGHTEVIDKAVAPTCTEAGKTEGKHCSVCEKVLVAQEAVAASGHKYQDKSDDLCHWTECACGEQTAKENHCGGVADETNKAVCDVCGSEYGDHAEKDGIFALLGCAGSAMASLFGLLVLGGFALVLKKKREE